MAKLPYPPAPELGWYSDDPVEGTPDSAVGTAEPQNDYGQPSTAEAATNTAFTAEPAATAAAAEPAATAPADTTPHAAENDIEDWDSLEHITLISAVEREFRMKFKMGEISSMKNVGEMASIIAARAKG